jgi:hypothetical protein
MLVVIYFYFPETRGKTLEEASLTYRDIHDMTDLIQIALIFDKEDLGDVRQGLERSEVDDLTFKQKSDAEVKHDENHSSLDDKI